MMIYDRQNYSALFSRLYYTLRYYRLTRPIRAICDIITGATHYDRIRHIRTGFFTIIWQNETQATLWWCLRHLKLNIMSIIGSCYDSIKWLWYTYKDTNNHFNHNNKGLSPLTHTMLIIIITIRGYTGLYDDIF